ncbi:hypothetical protein [Myroides profundi]|uniref:Uncharacterized protein n=1 Tax=Myroides profundi TaxID=480520 RepID=A0AAJ4W410_MYRPR|nr:hypothetical protein [Myroides profundi]AJH14593.1 hypothetical protein MPR_1411 [Myroides profundi]SEQ91361.1 hypothetical protein SAMN04488089_10795 [Myroides profundi]
MKNKSYTILSMILLLITVIGCSKEPSQSGGFEGEKDYKYFLLSALGSWPNTVHYITATNDVTQGVMDLNREGDEINSKGTYSYIVKNGYIYNYKTDQGVFKKFKYTNDKLVTEIEVPFSYINDVSAYTWADDNTLILFGDTSDIERIRYTVFNTTNLKIVKQGEVSGLEPFPQGYDHYSIGSAAYIDGVLYLQYGFRNAKWLTPNFYNIASISYPDFKVIKSEADTRSSGASNGSPYFKTSFVKDNDSFYYSCFTRTNSEAKDIYLFRIKTAEGVLDRSYEINLTQVLGGLKPETAMNYIGDNKMIIGYRDPAKGGSYNGKYAIIDLETRSVVRQLTELPLDEPYELGFFVQDKKVYFAINSAEEGNYVWIYDLKTDKVTKGMTLPDKISGFARFDKFYD